MFTYIPYSYLMSPTYSDIDIIKHIYIYSQQVIWKDHGQCLIITNARNIVQPWTTMFMNFFIVESSPLQFATFNLKMRICKCECGMHLYYGHEKTCYEKCQF